jgi:hypothetical protein
LRSIQAQARVSFTRLLAGSVENGYFLFQAVAKPLALDFQIVARLKVQPKTLARAEVASKSQCRVSSDRTLAMHDFVDAAWWHTDIVRKPVLRQLERLQEVQEQYLTRVNRPQLATGHGISVVVDEFHVMRITLAPAETDSPSVIDANAVLPNAIAP